MAPLRATLLLCGFCAVCTLGATTTTRAATAEPSALAFTDGRAGISLDGAWHVIVDPYDNGSLDYRSQPRPHGYFEDARPRDKSDLVEYDFARSPTLQVPGDWNTQRADLLYYEGTIWYQRRFDAALHPGGRAFVQFGAVAQRATVWLNGKRLGEHEGGFTPFAFEVTGLRAPTRQLDRREGRQHPARRRAAGAEHRLVELRRPHPRRAPRRNAARLRPRLPLVQLAQGQRRRRARRRCGSTARARRVKVTVEIPEVHAALHGHDRRTGRAALRVAAPRSPPWSPESPRLYDVVIRAGGDRVQRRHRLPHRRACAAATSC